MRSVRNLKMASIVKAGDYENFITFRNMSYYRQGCSLSRSVSRPTSIPSDIKRLFCLQWSYLYTGDSSTNSGNLWFDSRGVHQPRRCRLHLALGSASRLKVPRRRSKSVGHGVPRFINVRTRNSALLAAAVGRPLVFSLIRKLVLL